MRIEIGIICSHFFLGCPDFEFTQDEGIASLSTSGKSKCLVCSREFMSRSSANRHYRDEHLTYEKLNCEMCGKEFRNITTLKKHWKQIHGILHKDRLKSRINN